MRSPAYRLVIVLTLSFTTGVPVGGSATESHDSPPLKESIKQTAKEAKAVIKQAGKEVGHAIGKAAKESASAVKKAFEGDKTKNK
ncbi:MAG: hypothetical protein ACT4OO_13760 [Nitrospiraceae bacterium]